MGNFSLVDKLVLDLDDKKAWIFHGDVFDHTTSGGAKFIAKLGGMGYDWLILVNRAINWILEKFGKGKVSLSKKVKNSEVSRYGIIKYSKKINSNLLVSSLVEKPSLKNSPSNYAIIGRYVLPKKIISSLQNTKRGSSGEVQITDAMKSLIYNDNKFVGHIFSGTYLDCGTINGYNNSLKKF